MAFITIPKLLTECTETDFRRKKVGHVSKKAGVKTAGHDGKKNFYGYLTVSGLVLNIWHIAGLLWNYGHFSEYQ